MTRRIRFTTDRLNFGDRRLEGCVWEISGVLVPEAEARETFWSARLVLPDRYPGMVIDIHRIKLFSLSIQVWGEIRWRRNGERQMSIHRVEHPYSRQQRERVDKWLRVALDRLPRPGRPFGSAELNADELELAVRRAIAAWLQQGRRRPRLEDVAQFFTRDKDLPKINADQLKDRLRYHHLSFTRLCDEMIRLRRNS